MSLTDTLSALFSIEYVEVVLRISSGKEFHIQVATIAAVPRWNLQTGLVIAKPQASPRNPPNKNATLLGRRLCSVQGLGKKTATALCTGRGFAPEYQMRCL